jgi:hypothetical protein
VLRVEDKNAVGDFAAKRLEELGGGAMFARNADEAIHGWRLTTCSTWCSGMS